MAFGRELGQSLPSRTLLCFFGEMGTGKTTLIKGLVEGVTGIAPEHVTSPTFAYLHLYRKGLEPASEEFYVYHFDLYRLSHAQEFLDLGFDEYFSCEGICCMEWSERIRELIPKEAWSITLSHLTEGTREICLSTP